MSLNSEINEALVQLRDEGKLLDWRDFKYPNRQGTPGVLFQDMHSNKRDSKFYGLGHSNHHT